MSVYSNKNKNKLCHLCVGAGVKKLGDLWIYVPRFPFDWKLFYCARDSFLEGSRIKEINWELRKNFWKTSDNLPKSSMFDFGQKWAGGGGRVRFPLSPPRLSKFNSPHILPPLPAVRTQHDGYTCREELPLQALCKVTNDYLVPKQYFNHATIKKWKGG